MYGKILLALFSPILITISLVILKDLISLFRYWKLYKGQGIKMFYGPWIGVYLIFKKTDNRDVLKPYVELLNGTYKNEELFCYNNPKNPAIGVILKSPEIIKKFFLKEIDHTKKIPIVEAGDEKHDFFFKSGDHAMKMRGIFNTFFLPENLKNITPKLRDIIQEWMEIIKKENWNKEEKIEFKKIDMRKKMAKIMSSIVNEILFGDKNPPKVDGLSLPETEEIVLKKLFGETGKNIFNLLTFGYAHKLGLIKSSRDLVILAKKMKKACTESIKKRMESTRLEDLGCTVMDLLIKHNLTAEESDKLSMDEIVETSISMIGAGQDTSKNSIEILIHEISSRPKILKKIIEEELPKILTQDDDKYNYDAYFRSDYLNSVISESLRRDCPAPMSFPRVVTKTLKLGKYTIYKGSRIMVSYHSGHMNESLFENPEEFDDERFVEERKKDVKTNTFLPFSGGRRACIGKQLAELLIRMFLCCFFENFELKVISPEERKNTVMRFVKGIEECIVDIKPR